MSTCRIEAIRAYTYLIYLGLMAVRVMTIETDMQTGYWEISGHKDYLYYGFQEIHKLDRSLHCATTCLKTSYCVGFSYVKNRKFCYIYVHRVHDAGVKGKPFIGLRHYRKRIADCPINIGYTPTHNQEVCVKIYSIVVDYQQALQLCEEDGGHLYFMDSTFKKDMLKEHLKNSGADNGDYFVGAVANVGRGVSDFRWLNGRKVKATAWNPQEEFHKSKSCVVVRSTQFLLGVTGCSNSAMFICEYAGAYVSIQLWGLGAGAVGLIQLFSPLLNWKINE